MCHLIESFLPKIKNTKVHSLLSSLSKNPNCQIDEEYYPLIKQFIDAYSDEKFESINRFINDKKANGFANKTFANPKTMEGKISSKDAELHVLFNKLSVINMF